MRIRTGVLLAILAVACSKKDEPSAAKSAVPAPSAPAAAQPAVPRSSTPGGVVAESFVPESILSRVGDSHFVAAIDFSKVRRLTALMPDAFGCVRDLVDSARFAVVGIDAHDAVIGFLTRVPRNLANTCVATLGFPAVASGDALDKFDVGRREIAVAWRDDMAIIKERGTEVTGTLSKPVRDLIATMPPHAFGWIVIDDFANWKKQGVQRATFAFDLSGDDALISGSLEGTRPGSAKKYLTELVGVIKNVMKGAGFAVQDRWFKTSSTEMNAAFELKLPLAGLPRL